CQARSVEVVLGPGDALERVDQSRELGAGRQSLEANSPGFAIRAKRDGGDVVDLIDLRAPWVAAGINHLQRHLLRRSVSEQLRHLTGIVAGGASEAGWQDQAGRARARVEGEMHRAGQAELESSLELRANVLRDDCHTR